MVTDVLIKFARTSFFDENSALIKFRVCSCISHSFYLNYSLKIVWIKIEGLLERKLLGCRSASKRASNNLPGRCKLSSVAGAYLLLPKESLRVLSYRNRYCVTVFPQICFVYRQILEENDRSRKLKSAEIVISGSSKYKRRQWIKIIIAVAIISRVTYKLDTLGIQAVSSRKIT